jgi:four helix bundle protein
MNEFDHERLDVYRVALEFVVLASDVAGRMPKGRAYLADQLQRAATSIALNIAEGAGEFASAEKARFYRIARRSATESAAILDVCRKLNLDEARLHAAGREHLHSAGFARNPMGRGQRSDVRGQCQGIRRSGNSPAQRSWHPAFSPPLGIAR